MVVALEDEREVLVVDEKLERFVPDRVQRLVLVLALGGLGLAADKVAVRVARSTCLMAKGLLLAAQSLFLSLFLLLVVPLLAGKGAEGERTGIGGGEVLSGEQLDLEPLGHGVARQQRRQWSKRENEAGKRKEKQKKGSDSSFSSDGQHKRLLLSVLR